MAASTNQNIPYLYTFHRAVPNSAKFRENMEIPWLGSKFCVPRIAVVPTIK